MKLFATCTLLLATAHASTKTNNLRRKLSYPSIVGYGPETDVTDHANLDNDQAEIERYLAHGSDDSFQIALDIYQNGAYSKSYAQVMLEEPLDKAIPEDLSMEGVADSSTLDTSAPVPGFAKDEVPAPVSSFGFQYKELGSCNVGGLAPEDQKLDGCLKSNGTIDIDTIGIVAYSSVENKNGRTIQGFSTSSQAKMAGQVEYEKFVQYYQRHDYADHWVLSAFQQQSTQFPGGRGQADFSKYGKLGQSEVIKKGTAFMNVWMYVIREMEDALDDCVEGDLSRNEERVHAWDEAVAFYAGSREGASGNADNGVFPYRLAEKRCADYGTCGPEGELTTGTAKVNLDMIQFFKLGRSQITQGLCTDAANTKDEIVKLMYVPLVQGTLRYAWKQNKEVEGENEKSEAEGAVFAAAILPVVYACDKDDAAVIYDNMRVGFDQTDFLPVKKAFERQYKCMGITCQQVAGLVDSGGGYLEDASPCAGGSSKNKLALGLGLGLGIPLALVLACICYMSVSRHSPGIESGP